MAEWQDNLVYRKDELEGNGSIAVAKDDSALVKAYEKALKTFQGSNKTNENDVGTPEELGTSEPIKQPGDTTLATNARWEVGSSVRAVWSEDGLVYPASVVWVNAERCRVKFEGYGNEEEMELSALLPADVEKSWRERPRWAVGSRCRAVWSEDGLVYPAAVVWMRGGRCRVRFEGYGNEEELDVGVLLPPGGEEEEQHGRSTTTPADKVDPAAGSLCSDPRRKDTEKPPKEPPSLFRPPTGPSPPFNPFRGADQVRDQSEDVADPERMEGRPPPLRRPYPAGSPMAPPFPPPFRSPPDFPLFPPPPPLPCMWSPRGGEGSDPDMEALSSMLLSWYLCGYHTGCYMAKRQTEGPVVQEKPSDESPE